MRRGLHYFSLSPVRAVSTNSLEHWSIKRMASSTESLALYRNLLRAARTFPDFQLSMYIARRSKDDFRKNRSLKGAESQAALAFGKEQLEIVKRQSVIRGLYQAPKTVVELKSQQEKKRPASSTS